MTVTIAGINFDRHEYDEHAAFLSLGVWDLQNRERQSYRGVDHSRWVRAVMLLALVVAIALLAYALVVMALCRMAAQADIALGMKQAIGRRQPSNRAQEVASKMVRLDSRSALPRGGAPGALLDAKGYPKRPSARARRHRHTA